MTNEVIFDAIHYFIFIESDHISSENTFIYVFFFILTLVGFSHVTGL